MKLFITNDAIFLHLLRIFSRFVNIEWIELSIFNLWIFNECTNWLTCQKDTGKQQQQRSGKNRDTQKTFFNTQNIKKTQTITYYNEKKHIFFLGLLYIASALAWETSYMNRFGRWIIHVLEQMFWIMTSHQFCCVVLKTASLDMFGRLYRPYDAEAD